MNRQQKIILVVSILASFVAFLDGSVVNVALPAISHELGGGLTTQQWVVDAYLLTVGSFILLAGSLSDIFGRRRVLLAGLLGFAAASLVCALAPTSTFLILARAVQGVAGALLVPSSLALIRSSITGPAQGKAIGSWTAWTGIAFLIGPLLGGLLVESASWRFIFAINLIPIAICIWLLRLVAAAERTTDTKLDVLGALLCSTGLGATVFALIDQSQYGWGSPLIFIPLIGGLIALGLFFWHEQHTEVAMLPPSLFRIRNFTVGNIATVSIYGGLALGPFVIIIYLQQVAGLSAVLAGLAYLPVTIVMFFLSAYFGSLAGRIGPRVLMGMGPIVAGIGYLLMLLVSSSFNYWTQLLPGILVFALGLSMTVAPLTTAVLADVESSRSGIASAVNNAVARIAGLFAVALVALVVGNQVDLPGFKRILLTTAFLLILGGIISFIGIRNNTAKRLVH